MILSFKPQFVDFILQNTKIHSIREDKFDRWKPGMKIHFATGVRTTNYNQFKGGVCISVQDVEIDFPRIKVDGRDLMFSERLRLAHNDGFNGLYELFEWFNKSFKGKIIHWTDFKYEG